MIIRLYILIDMTTWSQEGACMRIIPTGGNSTICTVSQLILLLAASQHRCCLLTYCWNYTLLLNYPGVHFFRLFQRSTYSESGMTSEAQRHQSRPEERDMGWGLRCIIARDKRFPFPLWKFILIPPSLFYFSPSVHTSRENLKLSIKMFMVNDLIRYFWLKLAVFLLFTFYSSFLE